jgi:transcriptional regulator with XRE-family HTH domain
MITVAQSRAGRALLNWSQTNLANKAGLSLATIRNFELKAKHVSDRVPARIRYALERAGIKFINAGKTGGVGVRMRKRRARLGDRP